MRSPNGQCSSFRQKVSSHRPLVPALLDEQNFRQAADEQLDQARIEMTSALFTQIGYCLLHRPGRLVRAHAGQRVEYVGNGDDTPLKGNLFTAQAIWITTAIPLLMVRQGNPLRGAQQSGTVLADDPCTDLDVLTHHLPLLIVELARLAQYRIGNAYLADIMHRRSAQQFLGGALAETGGQRQDLGKMTHADHVQTGLVVLVFRRHTQALDDLQTGLLKLFNTHQRKMSAHASADDGWADRLGDVVHRTNFEATGFIL